MCAVNKPADMGAIKFLTGPQKGNAFQVYKPTTTIGRDTDNDIIIPDPTVSRKHAELTWNNGSWSIKNVSVHNLVVINGQHVSHGQQAPITEQNTVCLGQGTTFRLISPSSSLLGSSDTTNATQRASSSSLNFPSLKISTNTNKAPRTYPLAKPVISIGRDPSNDIVIDEPIVSGFHLEVIHENNQFIIVHPHPKQSRTTNGLLYQGRHIHGDELLRKPLARGDVFRIGNEHGTLVTLAYNDGSGAPQEVLPEIRPIPLGAQEITIGRRPDNTVVLKHPQVSGHHARLVQEQNTYSIIDLGSTNHTYVNGLQVTNHLLKPGDEIRIGPFKLIYTGNELTQYDESEGIRIDALQLKKVGNNQTILLNDISLSIPARKFVALVGGSGTGKSTLMDALNGLRPAQGKVFYNGKDYYRNLAAFSTQLGYVPQDDIIHRDVTVERALYYAAKLRLPGDFTEAQIKQRIDEVLDDVDMAHRRNLLVSKLSGGQRKRVSIALELLAKPSIFFLDEPTSGLDPGLDKKMMFLLRKLADKGHTIVLVTHATNNIKACDYVCFLAQGGRLAYFGPPEEAKKFFGQPDFAEIYSALEPTEQNKNIPAEKEAAFKASPDYQKYVLGPLSQGAAGMTQLLHQQTSITPPKRGNPWKQFVLLSLRYIELLRNDVVNLLILLLQAPVISIILVGLIIAQKDTDVFNKPLLSPTQGDAQKFLFIMAFAAVMFGCINAAREIVKEIHIYRRERTVNLGIIPYLLSKIAVLGVLCLLQSAVLILVVNAVASFHDGIFLPAFWEVYITLALTSLAGLMVGLTISAVVPNNDRAVSFIPLILIPQVIFSGIIFPLKDVSLQFLGIFFAVRWSMAAMGSSLGLDSNMLGGDKLFGTCSTCSTYHHDQQHLLLIWLALAVMIVVLGLATAFILKWKDKRR